MTEDKVSSENENSIISCMKEIISALDLSDIKDFFNILFFIIAGTIAILTYKQARKTIFQPIKTEVFKEQIKEFSKTLELFNGKEELELREDFGFDKTLQFNSLAMMDSFAELFFEVQINREKRPYSESNTGIVKKEMMEKHFEKVEGHISQEHIKIEREKSEPNLKYALWSNYSHVMLIIPNEYNEMKKKFNILKSNPLIPEKLIKLLVEYESLVQDNLSILDDLINECAKEMPEKYPNFDSMQKASIDWINSKYVSRFKDLSPKANEITNYIRSYFQTDNLFDS